MSKKTSQPRFVVLKLNVHIPLFIKREEAERLTPHEWPRGHAKFGQPFNREQEVKNNQIRLLGSDLEEPFKLIREATDKLFLIFESFDIVAHKLVGEEGVFEVNLITTQTDADKWVDTERIKKVKP